MNGKELVRLHPDDEAKLHPIALRRVVEWGEKLCREIPLASLSSQDLERWLSKDELDWWQTEIGEIRRWVGECLNDRFSIYCHSWWVTYDMGQVEKLIRLVWRRKSQWVRQQEQKKEAERKSLEYARELDHAVVNFQTQLDQNKHRIRFPKDRRDFGCDFSHLLRAGNDPRYREVAGGCLTALIPDNLKKFITSDYSLFYRLLPCADYSLIDGVPCLDFGFDVTLAIQAKFWLRPAKVVIDGYEFDFPLVQQPVNIILEPHLVSSAIYTVPLRQPHPLGHYYTVLSTDELHHSALGYQCWQAIPCVLVQGFLDGNLEPDGCTIVGAHKGWTTYRVKDLAEEVNIPDSFAQYLKEIGSWDFLAETGIISDKIAATVRRAMERARATKAGEFRSRDNDDVISALVALGWKQMEAEKEIAGINFPGDLTLEDRVKSVLQKVHNQ